MVRNPNAEERAKGRKTVYDTWRAYFPSDMSWLPDTPRMEVPAGGSDHAFVNEELHNIVIGNKIFHFVKSGIFCQSSLIFSSIFLHFFRPLLFFPSFFYAFFILT